MDTNNMQIVENEKVEQTEKDMLAAMVEKMDKQLFFTKLLAGASCALVVVMIIVAFLVVPPAVKSLNAAKEVMAAANTTLEEASGAIATAEDALKNVTDMSTNISQTSNNLNGFVVENAETMATAMKEIEEIDFKGLNQAIGDLQDAVGPFANFMRKFN